MSYFFLSNDPSTTSIYTLSLHDALPISRIGWGSSVFFTATGYAVLENASIPIIGEGKEEPNDTYVEQLVAGAKAAADYGDRKSTRLNSSHRCISYAVFCLKKKIKNKRDK